MINLYKHLFLIVISITLLFDMAIVDGHIENASFCCEGAVLLAKVKPGVLFCHVAHCSGLATSHATSRPHPCDLPCNLLAYQAAVENWSGLNLYATSRLLCVSVRSLYGGLPRPPAFAAEARSGWPKQSPAFRPARRYGIWKNSTTELPKC